MKKIAVIFGTRPEAVKMSPLILALRKRPDFEVQAVSTGQHREMLRQVIEAFEIELDADLGIMSPNQRLSELFGRAIIAVDGYLEKYRPDVVLVQGDTTSVLAVSLAAFHQGVRVGHVEAGLRTYDKRAPFPEEINRRLTSHVADYHFAPTEAARENLLREGISDANIYVTGNTVIDALLFAAAKVRSRPPEFAGLPAGFFERGREMVLITGHRRENFGPGFASICAALSRLAGRHPEVDFVYPVHLNPNVRGPVFELLSGLSNVLLLDPQGYLPFVALMDRSKVILTDSGGVQEEAPSLGKPVLVMRDTTERPEALACGAARLVGTDADKIVAGVSELLTSASAWAQMTGKPNPYGDGRASDRIIAALCAAEG